LENVDGKYRITEVTVEPRLLLKSTADLATAQAIMSTVEEHCFISNSVTAKVKLVPQFRASSE
jgi:organic hydroperoxide reductase OsmC/OhrA